MHWSIRTAIVSVCCLQFLAQASLTGAAMAESSVEKPWWKEQKIRFMWGQWNHARVNKSVNFWGGDLPRELFRNVALSGATVFAEIRGYKPEHARFAHELGMRYFATLFVNSLPSIPGGRKWVKESGEEHWFKCPLDEAIYEKWMVEPHLEGAREGLIDGIHIDWEYYGGHGEAKGVCYCDDCFAKFLETKRIKVDLPERAKRFPWLKERDLVSTYKESFSKRRVEMFTRIREKLQTANPNLLFSSYNMLFSDFSRAMHTPQTPFIVLDARHYYNDDRQPWWESYSSRLRKMGYLYIPGGWANSLFGAQASQVSAARWIYEASINEDGCWLWFERELDDEILRAYAAADREIKAVQVKLGKYLFNGQRDPNFATAVEWTGRPELEKAVIMQTYHLGEEHLAHINNVNTEWPLRVRVRFPRLAAGGTWTVRDPMSELYYTRDGRSPKWTTADLHPGVVAALEPRSDLFLLLSPMDGKLEVTPSHLIHSREFNALPEHAAASAQAGPVKAMINLYIMKNSIYGEKLAALLASAEKALDLPKVGWYFRMDKDDIGAGERWFLPEATLDGWQPIKIGVFWGAKGGTGSGWYRADIDIPALPEGKRTYLHFGAVDEQMVLWIDGEYAGDYDREPDEGWDKPFAIDVTDKLTEGKHHLALRVDNSTAAGGVWKPVSVLVGPAVRSAAKPGAVKKPAAPSGRLVYTATEPMGFGGPEGGLTIGNAIRTVDANGENQLRIRQLRGHLWSPSYSPDGKRIAFVHDAGGRGQIYVMSADGSNAVNLSNNTFCDRSPIWSPDGARIAFMSEREGDWDIYVMSADGSGQRRLAGNPGLDRAPAWSPDGTRLAWEGHVAGRPNIWVCNAKGRNSHPLIEPGKPMKIEKVIARKGTARTEDVEPIFPDNTFYLMDPVWSPDGERIACVGLSFGQMVVVVDADGSRMLQLMPWIQGVANICWSPDGARLAGAFRTAPQESERSGIFVIKADGTDKERQGRWLVDVSPQGPRLGGARRHGLLTWYSHGSAQPRRVVKTFCSLAWSPDGSALAFSSDMAPSGAFYVYTISADGGKPQRLDGTMSAWPQEIMWPVTSEK